MDILYYYWGENSSEDIVSAFQQLGHNIKVIDIPFTDYDEDPAFYSAFSSELNQKHYDLIFTFDFFPLISNAAQKYHIPYISWIYDMPHTTLFSPAFCNEGNYIFIFDHDLYNNLLLQNHHSHIYHLPLAVDTDKTIRMLGAPPEHLGRYFQVSFVGSLYENCLYNQIRYLPDYLKGYLSGIINAQQKIYGGNIIDGTLTPDVLTELKKHIKLDIPKEYHITYKKLFTDLINAKITSAERIHLLTQTAARFPFTLFTGSDSSLIPNAQFGGIVSYNKEMPGIFRTSKINLNITLRSITSGIPLRALDIMGAGGFLLSNYQPELDEYFKDGEDCVQFESEEDMLAKIEYYLTHEKERNEIACNGFRKVHEEFSYKIQLKKILSTVYPPVI